MHIERRRHRHTLAAIVAVGALALAACGGGHRHLSLSDLTGPSAATSSTPTTTTVPADVSSSVTTNGSAASSAPATGPAAAWTPATGNLAGMPSECGNISLVSARPDRDEVIASVSLHGLWSNTAGATSWTALGQGPASAQITNRGSTIVYDPQHPSTYWESGIYNSGGVYRTDDNGSTFQQLGSVTHVDAVSVDMTDPQRKTLVVGLHEQTGVMKSTDAGHTWSSIASGLPANVGFTSSPLVIDAHTFLLGTNHGGPGSGVFRTTDGGATWTEVFTGGVIGQPLLTSSGALLWVVEASGGIISSADGGMTWKTAGHAGVVDSAAPSIVELPGGAIAAVGGSTVVMSKDGGATWHGLGPTLPFRPSGLAYAPQRHALYIWYFTCDRSGQNPVPADAIMQLDVASA
jgi:photosystem II stability/assembly factor-like uncharacterized protein